MHWMALVMVAAATMLLSPAVAQDSRRPSDYAACGAWNAHVQDLIDHHRLSTEISDTEFDTALRLFGAARETCLAGRFEEAFHFYSIIPLGRPQRIALR